MLPPLILLLILYQCELTASFEQFSLSKKQFPDMHDCSCMYSMDYEVIYMNFLKKDSSGKEISLSYTTQDNGKTFEPIVSQSSPDHILSFSEITVNRKYFVGIEGGKEKIYFAEKGKSLVTSIEINKKIAHIHLSDSYHFLLAAITEENELYIYDIHFYAFYISSKVLDASWSPTEGTEDLYYLVNERNTFVLIKLAGWKFEQKIVLETNVHHFELHGELVFISKNVDNKIKSAPLVIVYPDHRTKTAKFPSLLNLKDHQIVYVDSDVIFCLLNTSTVEVWLTMALVDEWQFRKLITINYENVGTLEYDILVWDSIPGLLIANTVKNIWNNRHVISIITYNYGRSWKELIVSSTMLNETEYSCRVPECFLTLVLNVHHEYNGKIIQISKAPHLLLGTGYLSRNGPRKEHRLFISRDAGATWSSNRDGHFVVESVDYGGVLIIFEHLSRKMEFSLDEGRNWNLIEIFPDHDLYFSVQQTKISDLSVLFMLFNSNSKEFISVKVDFSTGITYPCQEGDMVDWTPRKHLKTTCFHGQSVNFRVKMNNRICVVSEKLLHSRVTDVCACTNEDFICSFGYMTDSHGSCIADNQHQVDSKVVEKCTTGQTYIETSNYQALPMAKCVVVPKSVEQLSKLRVCGISGQAKVIYALSSHQIYIRPLDENLFKPLSFDISDYLNGMLLDAENQLFYYIEHGHVMVKSFLLHGSMSIKPKVFYASHMVFQMQFDYMGRNIFVLTVHCIYAISIGTQAVKTIVKSDEHIVSFKLYPQASLLFYTTQSGGLYECIINEKPVQINLPYKSSQFKYAYMHTNNSIYYYHSEEVYNLNLNDKVQNKVKSKLQIIDMEVVDTTVIYITPVGIVTDHLQRINDLRSIKLFEHSSKSPNCGCSHMCIYSSGKSSQVCECPDGMHFSIESQNCVCDFTSCQPCSNDQFTCESDKKCIPIYAKCDGNKDCQDESDEYSCPRLCQEEEFMCFDGSGCVLISEHCDGISNCYDNSDEKYCGIPDSCPYGHFTCQNHRCINYEMVCNKIDDCGDGSDEKLCQGCQKNQFSCDDGKICLHQKKRCDHVFDCDDRTDEHNCHIADLSFDHLQIGENESIRCNDTSHIYYKLSQACDHFTDCPDGEDEALCGYKQECSFGYRQCLSDQKCYTVADVCDGVLTCSSGEDEECQKDKCLSSNPKFSCKDGTCIDADKFCNHQNDCPDSSDEIGNCEYSNFITNLRIYTSKNNQLTIQYTLQGEVRVEDKMTMKLIHNDSGHEKQLEVKVENLRKTGFIEIDPHLPSCNQVKLKASMTSNVNTQRDIIFTSNFIPLVPSHPNYHNGEIFWNYDAPSCSPLVFYIECTAKDRKPIHKNFTTEKSYKLPKSRKLGYCRLAFCPTLVFNLSCGHFSDPVYIGHGLLGSMKGFFFIAFLSGVIMMYMRKVHPACFKNLLDCCKSAIIFVVGTISRILPKGFRLRYTRLFTTEAEMEHLLGDETISYLSDELYGDDLSNSANQY